MRGKNFLSLLLCAGTAATPLLAARDAGLPGEFLNFGVGGRPLALGRAYTAVADDVDSVYWNPAGLSTYRSSQFTLQHSPLPLGGAYQYAAFSQPIYAFGSLGVGVVNLTSGDVPRISATNAQIGAFNSRETGYLLSYGQHLPRGLGLGATVKMAEHVIDGRSARGYGVDLGSLYPVTEKFQVGAMVRNALAPTYKFATDKETFPTILRAGGRYSLFNSHVLTALDLDKTLGAAQSPRWHFGVEGYVISNIVLRLGIDTTEISGGVGLKWGAFQLDYAAGFQDLGLLSRVSFKAFFGGYEVDVKADPSVFSPVGLRNRTYFRIATTHRQRVVRWVMTIRNGAGQVVRSFQGYNAPPAAVEWDGRDSSGKVLRDGEYIYRLAVTDRKNKTETTPPRMIRISAPTPFEIEAK